MNTRMIKTIKALEFLWRCGASFSTAGEVKDWTKIPLSTQKRYLKKAEEMKLVVSDYQPYKTTGKVVYALTDFGVEYASGIGSLPL